MLKVYIYYLHKKNYNKKITTKLTKIEAKHRTNLRGNFAKILKMKQDYL